MRKMWKRIGALVLAAATILSLAGCKEKDDTVESGGLRKVENVYKATEFKLEDAGSLSVNTMLISKDRLYIVGGKNDMETGMYMTGIYSYNLEGTDFRTVMEMTNDYGAGEENVYQNTYIGSAFLDNNDKLWVMIEEHYEDYRDENNPIYRNGMSLVTYDEQGNEAERISLNELMGKGEDEYIYAYNFVFDDTGVAYCNIDSAILALNWENKQVLFEAKPENADNAWINNLVRLGDGTVAATIYEYSETNSTEKMMRLSSEKKGWGDEIVLQTTADFYNSSPGDDGYLLFYNTSTCVYGLKPDGTAEEIINWINSDINSNNISSISYVGDGKFLAFSYSWETSEQSLMYLDKVPASEIKETAVITFATMYLYYDLRSKVIDFNKSNDDYRVEIKDYSIYNTSGDYMKGYDQLNTDILAGKIPDIINLEGLNASNYINKGLLADIYQLMGSDKSRYDENVLKLCETDGKLYQFIPSYYLMTVAGKTSVVGDKSGWTLDDLNALMSTMPEGTQSFGEMTRQELLYYSYYMAMDQFIDWENGKCNFGDNFVKLLEFANTMPEEFDYEGIWDDPTYWESRYTENKVLLEMAWISNVRGARNYKESFQEDITFIGFPTDNQRGTVLMPGSQYAISAKTKFPAECWEFMKSFVMTADKVDFANSGGYYYGEFGIDKEYMQLIAEYEMTPLKEREGYQDYGNGGIIVGKPRPASSNSSSGGSISILPEVVETEEEEEIIDDELIDNEDIDDEVINNEPADEDDSWTEPDIDLPWDYSDYENNYHLTKEEVDKVLDLIGSASKMIVPDETIMKIIEEESAEYFGGRRSAEDVTKQIQSRVQLYISESM